MIHRKDFNVMIKIHAKSCLWKNSRRTSGNILFKKEIDCLYFLFLIFLLFMNTKKLQKIKRTKTKHLIPHGRKTYLHGKKKNKQSNKQKRKEVVSRFVMCVNIYNKEIANLSDDFRKIIVLFSTEEFCSTL